MAKRIVVNLRPEARPSLEAVSEMLARQVDMRIGMSLPRHGMLVGEVKGQMEVDRILSMAEVETVRVHAEGGKPRAGRAGGSRLH